MDLGHGSGPSRRQALTLIALVIIVITGAHIERTIPMHAIEALVWTLTWLFIGGMTAMALL